MEIAELNGIMREGSVLTGVKISEREREQGKGVGLWEGLGRYYSLKSIIRNMMWKIPRLMALVVEKEE